MPDENEYHEITSICEVYHDDKQKVRLLRLADVDQHGKIVKFEIDMNHEKRFGNRDRLFVNYSLPEKDGIVGVWKWTPEPNKNDPEKDYMDPQKDGTRKPIEIIVVEDADTVEKLAEWVRGEISNLSSNLDTLICCGTQGGFYKGLFCKKTAREKVSSKEIVSLPYYEISSEQIVETKGYNNQPRWFYNQFSLEEQSRKLVLIYPPEEILKSIIITRSSWNKMKAGFTRDESQKFKKYINTFRSEDVCQELAKKCSFSEDEAESYINEFIKNFDAQLYGTDCDTILFSRMVQNNVLLREKYKEKIKDEWEVEHSREISEKHAELEKLQKENDEADKILKNVQSEINGAQSELEKIRREIGEKQKLAVDVNNEMQQLIADSKNKASEAIAKMLFVQAAASKTSLPSNKAFRTDSASSDAMKVQFLKGCELTSDAVEYSVSEDMIVTLEDNLQSAGVDVNMKNGLAALFYAAYQNNVPLLLAGPNAAEIVDAFSAARWGKLSDRLECAGNYQSDAADLLNSSDFVMVNGLFSANWVDHIESFVSRKPYCVFTNPFVEDLLIEPKGLYNYMVPVFTDLYVTGLPKVASNLFARGCPAPDCSPDSGPDSAPEDSRRYERYLTKIGASRMYRYNIVSILKTLQSLPDHSADWDLYAITPYVSVTGNRDSFVDFMGDPNIKVSRKCLDTIRQYLGAEQ